jgi:hypothetical protein
MVASPLLLESVPPRFGGDEFLALDPTFLDVHQPQQYRAYTSSAQPKGTSESDVRSEVWQATRITRVRALTYRAKRKAKGMLLFPPEALMIAEETNGPMNAEVLPICNTERETWNMVNASATMVMNGMIGMTYDREKRKEEEPNDSE